MTGWVADDFERVEGGSGDEDSFAVPVQVFASGGLGSIRKEERFAQGWSAVVLAGQGIGLDGGGQGAGKVDAQSAVDGEHAGVKGHVVGGAGGQAVAGIKTLGRCAVFPGLDVAGQQHPGRAERGGPQAAEDAAAGAVGQDLAGEYVLPDPGRGQQDPLGFAIWARAGVLVLADLVAQFGLQHGQVEFFLAKQGQFAAVLEPEEVRQPGRADAFSAGGVQQQPVGGSEPGWVVAEDGTGQDVPAGAMGTGAIQELYSKALG